MKTIVINSPKYGKYTVFVDDNDYKLVRNYRWHIDKRSYTIYASTNIMKNGRSTKIYIHRLIMGYNENFDIDYVNRNGLDNRRVNLRWATRSQNGLNRVKNTKSKYKGISFNRSTGKWETYITKDGKHKWLGSFENKLEAAKAYDKAAIYYFGNYALLNFAKETYSDIKYNPDARIVPKKKSSQYYGVSWRNDRSRWTVHIKVGDKKEI